MCFRAFRIVECDVPTRLRNPLLHAPHRLLVQEPPDVVWISTFQRSGGKSGGVIRTRMGGTVPSGSGGRGTLRYVPEM